MILFLCYPNSACNADSVPVSARAVEHNDFIGVFVLSEYRLQYTASGPGYRPLKATQNDFAFYGASVIKLSGAATPH